MRTRDALLEKPSRPGPAPEPAANRVFAGRYRAVRLLKRGQDVETLLGTDLSQGCPVVIKTAATSALSTAAQMRLEHEAGVLRQIQSPRFSPLLDLGREKDLLYLVMPFIPGITLQTRLTHGALSVSDAITVGRCLLAALQEAHEHRVLHRDVKPANVIVDEGTPLHRAALIDFGLARTARLDASIRDQPVGTARYISPEAAGLLDQDVDECSDLYSAGVLLFECLAGRPPFQGESVGELLRQHMTVRPPDLRSLGLAVPRVLDEVIQRLLRKDPRDRYQSAEAVLADLTVIAEALGNGVAEPALVVGLRDRRRTLTEPAFVGRGDELAALDNLVEHAQLGQGGLVLLEAESGGGKSRLLVELAQRSARQGAWVLRGHGLDQVALHPFQVLAGVAEEVIAAARSEPGLAERIQRGLGDQREAVCAVLPELAEVLGARRAAMLGPETFGEARSLQALAALLDALGSAERPALVLLDDCQWCDQLTLKLLAHWQRRQDAEQGADRHILLVVGFRSEEVPRGHFLRTLPAAAHFSLPTFQPSDVRRLAESMAGPLPEEALAVVERLAEGSPFMASAVLRGLVESGALVAEPAGWRVDRPVMADVHSSRHAAAFLARRLELLPPDTVRLLTVGAVLGKEFDLDFAATLANQAPSQAITALDEARRRHILWVKTQETRCVFVHDKLRQTLLDRLRSADRVDLHRRAALHLEKQDAERVFELAHHFDAAGESERALPYAIAAATRARSQHALEIAEQQYLIAERGAQAADEAMRYRVAEGLSDVLMLSGRYEEAGRKLERVRELAQGDLARIQVEGRFGELAFKRGDMQTASEAIERSLRLLGRTVPRSPLLFLVLFCWESVVQILHTLFPRLFLARRPLAGAETELTAIRLYSRLTYAYWFARGKIPCFWAHLREMNLAERYPPTMELAQAYSEHAPAMTLVPYFRRGIAYAEKSLAIRKAFGDLWGQGQTLHFYGLVLYAASRFNECIEKCREAVRLLERTGDRWEVNIARHQMAASLYRLGDLNAAVEEARRIHQSGLDLGDAQASGFSLDIWSRASGGKVPPETIQAELNRPSADVQRTAQVYLAQGVQLIGDDRPGDAADVLKRARKLVREAGMKNVFVYPLLPWLATALRLEAEKALDCTPWRRRALLRRAKTAARRGLRIARRFQNDLPHALRESGLLAAMQGRNRRARKYLDQGLAVAERQGARFEHAQTLLACGRVGLELGWQEAAEDVITARQALRSLGASFALDEAPGPEPFVEKPATLSLADRFDTVLDAGRKIATALHRRDIFQAVREAALRLLRGERCLLLQLEGDDGSEDLTTVSGEIETQYSREMAQRALAGGRVVVFAEGRMDEAGEAALLAGVRSALCAPIFVRGRPAGCFYVAHRGVGGLFGEDEERLAEFIATIAGAALENAEGFAELQRLNRTLEQRVAERTVALEDRAKDLATSNTELERIAAELRRSQHELQLAKDAADKANKAKSEFLANMSHEIRTPMNGIIGMAELALQTRLSIEQRNYMTTVMQSADALLRLLNDILDFSKVEAGKLELEAIPFNLRDCLDDTVHALGIRAMEKGLELACHIPPDVPAVVVGDAGRLRQIVTNLVGNALKFTEKGEVVVEVKKIEDRSQKTEVRRPEDGAVHSASCLLPSDFCLLEFSVRDTGLGIPADKLQLIFEAFSQADTSTTRRYGGTGLGLTISRQLSALMGGRIWVESDAGKGSTFHFTGRFGLPAEGAPAPAEPESLRGLPVLVVDDNATNRHIFRESLLHWGMKPVLTEGGVEALSEMRRAAAAGQPYPLVLLDAMMPEMDGFTLAERIQADAELAECTMIMLSSAGYLEDAARCRERGIARCLTKPVKQSELRDAILRALGTPGEEERRGEKAGAEVPRRSLRILLAEDGLVNQQVASRLLEVRGHSVVVANNGKEALAALEREAFDLVLMDVQMPLMDGFETTTAIRHKEERTGGHLPIIAMTAHAMKGDRERCLEAGMDGYLSKPIRSRALYEAVEGIAPAPADAVPEGSAPPLAAVLDWDAAVDRVGGRTDLLKQMARLFFKECAEVMPIIRQAITDHDRATLQLKAHRLKGSTECFAARNASAAALKLEMMGRDGNLDGAEAAWTTLEEEMERLLPALEAFAKGN